MSGFLETAICGMYCQYAQDKSAKEVSDFVGSHLERFQNPKMGAILELIGRFSTEWKRELEEKVQDKQKDAVDSIVNNRHQIAHGRNTNISIVQVEGYYKSVKELVELMETQCNG